MHKNLVFQSPLFAVAVETFLWYNDTEYRNTDMYRSMEIYSWKEGKG